MIDYEGSKRLRRKEIEYGINTAKKLKCHSLLK